MRLLECHIANFGAFNDYTITFNDGVNVVLQPNGWGKTTLAAYIKAMLYGFGSKRVRDVTENERLRYRPWQGGKYGGTLDIEVSGQRYRIIRTFGETARYDTCDVLDLDSGKRCDTFGDNPGETLFGIDAAAFQRSIYLSEALGSPDRSGNTALRSRLNSLVNGADDVADIEPALAALDVRRKYYKKTGNRGRLAELSNDMQKLADRAAILQKQAHEQEGLQEESERLAKSVSEYDAQIAELQRQVSAASDAMSKAKSLELVRSKLTARRDDARGAYDAELDKWGAVVPSLDGITRAGKTLAARKAALAKADECEQTARALSKEAEAIAAGYGGTLPSDEEIRAQRASMTKLRALETSLEEKRQSIDGEPSFSAFETDSELIPDVERTLGEWAHVNQEIERLHSLEVEQAGVAEKWKGLSAVYAAARDEANRCGQDAPDPTEVEHLERLHNELGALETRRRDAAMSYERARAIAQSHAAQTDPSVASCSTDDIHAVRELSEGCTRASACVSKAREASEAQEQKLRELEHEAAAAKEAYDSAQAKAAEARGTAASGIAVALFAAGVACALAGAYFGLLAVVALGIACIVAGAVLQGIHSRARKTAMSASQVAVEEARGANEQAEGRAAEQRDIAQRTRQELADAEAARGDAQKRLTDTLRGVFGADAVDEETVTAQAPALIGRMEAGVAHRKADDALAADIKTASENLDEANRRIIEACDDAGLDIGSAAEDANEIVAHRLRNSKEALNRAIAANKTLLQALNAATGAAHQSLDDPEAVAAMASIEEGRVPGLQELEDARRESQGVVGAYEERVHELLRRIGLHACSDKSMQVDIEAIRSALVEYHNEAEARKREKEDLLKLQDEVSQARDAADVWARSVGTKNCSWLDDKFFNRLDGAAAHARETALKAQLATKQREDALVEAQAHDSELAKFFSAFGAGEVSDPEARLRELERSAKRLESLKADADAAASALDDWLRSNPDIASNGMSDSAEIEQTTRRLLEQREALVKSRDEAMRRKAQCDERRARMSADLEELPKVRHEANFLSLRRQRAASSLFTIEKTSEFLEQSRRAMDNRYLGGLSDRFCDYMGAWLDDGKLVGSIDEDFRVMLDSDTGKHDSASYSTGYSDLVDICLRLSVVDTLFVEERPFIIMDDPFAHMDPSKLGRAVQLLEALSQRYQILYFCCHPSRTASAAENTLLDTPSFSLPEQRAAAELPRARAQREALERAQAQASLVASYEVVGATPGRAAVRIESRGNAANTIYSNLFDVRFALDESRGTRDAAYEVHFIDEKGRVLCDRKNVAVVDGQVVPTAVRFCLTTHEDGGSTYWLVAHEDGRPENELLMKVPYSVNIAFVTDDFGF